MKDFILSRRIFFVSIRSMDKSKRALDRAIELLKGRTPFARAIGFTAPAVDYWREAAGKIPAEVCPTIERLTDRQVTCEQLRPDVDWAYLREAVK